VSLAAAGALAVSAITCGVVAESKADDYDRLLTQMGTDNRPIKYDAATAQQVSDLRSGSDLYRGLAIGLATTAGLVAVFSATLFYVDRRAAEAVTLRPRLLPSVAARQAGLAAQWEF
jgi:hypothetical protein